MVDDDDKIRDVIAALLTGEDYPVETAANGAQALEVIEQHRPSLVVLDMHMPVLDGRGFAEQAKARGYDPPILVVTATRASAKQAAAEIGAAGSLSKPFEVRDLLDAVAALRIP